MTTRKYCNKCGKDVTREPNLSLGCDWNNTNWMEKYTPYDVTLCEEHAMEFIDQTLDKEAFERYLRDKEEYEERGGYWNLPHDTTVR